VNSKTTISKALLDTLLVLRHVVENLLAAHGADALLVGARLAVEALVVELSLTELTSIETKGCEALILG